MNNIVERLRRYNLTDKGQQEAADEIERLSAENKRLTALSEADAKEIGSYRKRKGLRGGWKKDGEEIERLLAENRNQMAFIKVLAASGNEYAIDYVERVSTEHTQSGDVCTQDQERCRHMGDTRTEGGMTFCDESGVELL